MEKGLISPSKEGVPQGGPLSPILSNVYLDKLDKELKERGLCFVRYAMTVISLSRAKWEQTEHRNPSQAG